LHLAIPFVLRDDNKLIHVLKEVPLDIVDGTHLYGDILSDIKDLNNKMEKHGQYFGVSFDRWEHIVEELSKHSKILYVSDIRPNQR
jgi:hypothetical protein